MISQNSCQPNNDPACVDATRCEPPMAAVAIKIPGPKAFNLDCQFDTADCICFVCFILSNKQLTAF